MVEHPSTNFFLARPVLPQRKSNGRVRRDPGLGGFFNSNNPEVVYEAERLCEGSR